MLLVGKKITLVLLLSMLLLPALLPITASAQLGQQNANDQALRDAPAANPNAPASGPSTVNADVQQSAQQYVNSIGQNTAPSDLACTSASFGGGQPLAECIASLIYFIGPGIGGYVAYIGAYFLDIAVQLSLNSAAYALDFITQGWTVVRDMANMFFIFILIYTAFEIMFQANTSDTMKRIAWIIIIALIINFSFFITRVVIDAGNILAVQFYNAIQVDGATIGNGTKDLSAAVMSGLKIQQLFNTQSFDQAMAAAGNSVLGGLAVLSLVYLTAAAMFWILFFIFLQVGIKFLLRVVGLWFIIISSPLAFVSKTLKKTEGLFATWQKWLIEFSFYPAIFLFMYFLLAKFMQEMTAVNGQSGGNIINGVFNAAASANAAAGNGTPLSIAVTLASVAIRLGFIVAMMYVALKVADWVVKKGSAEAHGALSFAGAALKGVTRFGGGLALRTGASTTAWGARHTLGRGANALSRSQLIQSIGANSIFGRPLRAALRGIATSSLDVRNAPGGSVLRKGMSRLGLEMNLGTPGGKGGIAKSIEERAKVIEARAKGMKGDETDIRNAQEAAQTQFVKDYRNAHGPGAYNREFAKQTAALETAQKRAAAWEKKLEEAKKGTDPEAVSLAEAAFNQEKASVKYAQDALKALYAPEDAGKKAVKARDNELISAFASRLSSRSFTNLGMPGRGSMEGAAKAWKLIKAKGAKDLAEEALKKYKEEAGEVEEGEEKKTEDTATKDTTTKQPLTRAAAAAVRQRFGSDAAATARIETSIDEKLRTASSATSNSSQQLAGATIRNAEQGAKVAAQQKQSEAESLWKIEKTGDDRIVNKLDKLQRTMEKNPQQTASALKKVIPSHTENASGQIKVKIDQDQLDTLTPTPNTQTLKPAAAAVPPPQTVVPPAAPVQPRAAPPPPPPAPPPAPAQPAAPRPAPAQPASPITEPQNPAARGPVTEKTQNPAAKEVTRPNLEKPTDK